MLWTAGGRLFLLRNGFASFSLIRSAQMKALKGSKAGLQNRCVSFLAIDSFVFWALNGIGTGFSLHFQQPDIPRIAPVHHGVHQEGDDPRDADANCHGLAQSRGSFEGLTRLFASLTASTTSINV